VEIDNYEHGRPSWVDVSVNDLTRSAGFYGGLFGWDTPAGPPEMGGYIVASIGGKSVAGISPKMNPEAPSAWATYVNVDLADSAAEAVPEAGGQVLVPPMDVADVGRLAIVADPTGAVIGMWQPRQHRGAQLVNEANTWVWSMLFTTDPSVAGPFYDQVFGWAAKDDEAGQTVFSLGGHDVAGMSSMPAEMPADVPPHWHVYFAVVDTDASVNRAKDLGGSLVFGPVPTPYGQMATLFDRDGVAFSVIGSGASS
jgi:uncharacterized protein